MDRTQSGRFIAAEKKPLSPNETEIVAGIRKSFADLHHQVASIGESRSISSALTHLETSLLLTEAHYTGV